MNVNQKFDAGDRVPDFVLSDQHGTKRVFYNEVKGRPLLLLIAGEIGASSDAAFREFAGRAPIAVELGADCLAVTRGSVADNAQIAARCGLEMPIYADSQGELVAALAGPAPLSGSPIAAAPGATSSLTCYLLDPNQRVLAVTRGSAVSAQLDSLLESLREWSGRGLGRVTPPVLLLPNTLEPALCEDLIAAWQGEHHEGSFSTGRVDAQSGEINAYDPSQKKTLEHVVTDQDLNRRVTLALARRIGPELVKVFNYASPFRFDAHVVMRYQPERGDFFGMHRDNLRQQNRRRFAVSLNLNDDFEGGDLYFPEYSSRGTKMAKGTACVFSCALLHEARPVTRGERFVLTNFFCDPDEPDQRVAPERRLQMRV